MAAGLCQMCGKHTMFGRTIRHRHSGRWERRATEKPRTFRPNVHKQVIQYNGEPIKLNICTRCLRTLSKVPKVRA